MKQLQIVFILFLNVLYSNVFAQIGEERWNHIYKELGENAEIKEVIEITNGSLLAVGNIREKENQRGLLLIIDELTGNIINKKVFSADENEIKDCGFNSIAENGDASIYLVGYCQIRDKVKRAWLLHLDENFESLNGVNGVFFPNEINKESTNVFEKVACLNDGTCIIAGKSSEHLLGDVWLFAYKNNKNTLDIPFRQGKFKDIRALIVIEDKVWLCGNSYEKDKAAIFCLIDKTGAVFNPIRDLGTIKNYEAEINYFAKTLEGDLLMVGKWHGVFDKNGNTEKNQHGDTDVAFFKLIDRSTNKLATLSASDISNNDNDNGFLVLPIVNTNNKYLIVNDSFYKKEKFYQIHTLGEKQKNISYSLLKTDTKIDISFIQVLNTLQKNNYYIFAINETQKVERKNNVHLIAYEPISIPAITYAPKGKPNNPFLLSNIYLQDDNGDACLSERERGAIKLIIKNISGEDIEQGTQVNVEIENAVDGIRVVRTSQNLTAFPKGSEKTVSIAVSAAENCQSGITQLRITVSAKGQSVPIIFSLCSKTKVKNSESTTSNNTRIHFSEELRKSITKNEKNINLTGSVYTSNRLKNKPTLTHNGIIELEPGKGEMKWEDKGETNGEYEFKFSIPVQLSEDNRGKNTFFISIDGVTSDKIEVQYVREFNLHVVSIGVPDTLYGLKYTTNDAQDFAQKMGLQKDNGFFHDVILYNLWTKETTSKEYIEKQFGTLLKKFRSGEIKKDDYLMILISSHGRIMENGNFGIIPYSFDPANEDATTVDYAYIVSNYLSKIGCKRFVFIDACHSGKSSGKGVLEEQLAERINAAYNASPELVSFNSCSGTEQSYEYPEGKNGVFTQALLDILDEKPIKEPIFIRIEDVQNRLKSKMANYLNIIKKQQTPEVNLGNQTPDLTLFVIPTKNK